MAHKAVTEDREFVDLVRQVGERLAPLGSTQARIKALADYVGGSPSKVQKWWYGQTFPGGDRAVIVQRLLSVRLPLAGSGIEHWDDVLDGWLDERKAEPESIALAAAAYRAEALFRERHGRDYDRRSLSDVVGTWPLVLAELRDHEKATDAKSVSRLLGRCETLRPSVIDIGAQFPIYLHEGEVVDTDGHAHMLRVETPVSDYCEDMLRRIHGGEETLEDGLEWWEEWGQRLHAAEVVLRKMAARGQAEIDWPELGDPDFEEMVWKMESKVEELSSAPAI